MTKNEKIKTKLIKKNKENESVKNIFLPLTSSNKIINQNNNENKISIYNMCTTNNYLSSSSKIDKQPSISLSFLRNSFMNKYHSTSPNAYRQILTKYKNKKNIIRRNNDIKYNFGSENCKTTYNDKISEDFETKKFQIFPIVKKLNIRDLLCNLYDGKEELKDKINNNNKEDDAMKNGINNNKEKTVNIREIIEKEINKSQIDKNEIKENDRLNLGIKFNSFKRNEINNIKKSETFNTINNTSITKRKSEINKINNSINKKEMIHYKNNPEPDDVIKNIKLLNRNRINTIKNDSSIYKTFFLQKLTPRKKKNNNQDIIDLLNKDL